MAVLVAGIGFLVLAVVAGNVPFGLVAAVALAAMGFMAPEIWLSRRIKKRQKQILLALPDTPCPPRTSPRPTARRSCCGAVPAAHPRAPQLHP